MPRLQSLVSSLTLALVLFPLGVSLVPVRGEDWLEFRGLGGASRVEQGSLPVELSAADVRWSTNLPGRGLSGVLVVGERAFVTTSDGPTQDRLHLICLSTATGEILWDRQVWATGRTMCHSKTSVAAPTPCSDGTRVYAIFSSNDLVCFDLDGNLQWLRGITYDYPNVSNSLGMASSLLVTGGTVIVPVENDSESYSLGLDSATGANRWRLDRPKGANWTSPVVLAPGLVALQSKSGIDAIRVSDGSTVWQYAEGADTVSSSALADGVLYIPSSGITALTLDPADPAKEPKQAWRNNQLSPSTASCAVAGNAIYCINGAGVLTAGDRADGKRRWQLRLQGPYSGTPVTDGRHLWAVNEAGLVQVVELGEEEGKVVATLDLGDEILCSPAAASGALYVRSNTKIHKIGK
ncbi:MAG: pyrrolo-quinoline quinone [Planctomycetota bacterium]|nr:MAG: pyrrolo-quinoline quinone [Planctomycetota bacterium]